MLVINMSKPILPKEKLRLQVVLGTLLYYARAIDSTLLPPISDLSSEQANGSKRTMAKASQLLDYCVTNPESIARFHASLMYCTIKSNACYLSVSKAWSRVADYIYLSSQSKSTMPIPINGVIHLFCHMMSRVLSSATQAKLGALIHNREEPCLSKLRSLKWAILQAPTVFITDNSIAAGIASNTIKQRCSKVINLQFSLNREHNQQGQVTFEWKKGRRNLAKYFTKYHHKKHHAAIWSAYLSPQSCEALEDGVSLNSDTYQCCFFAHRLILVQNKPGRYWLR
jgi:hypothetical protein